jgi:hypothetical protein
MNRIRIDRPNPRRAHARCDVVLLDPRDRDVLRAKARC